ncbi:MAG TPA: aminopeptidase N, partial [Dyella sp.]|nr:aminopeptidase N [Dyella sp.]
MTLANETAATPIRLRDYRRPPWSVDTVELDVDLGIDAAEVTARLVLRRDVEQSLPLRLDGEGLELLAISLDGHALDANRYRYENSVLEVDGA